MNGTKQIKQLAGYAVTTVQMHENQLNPLMPYAKVYEVQYYFY